MVTERPTILESWSGKKLVFFQVGSAKGVGQREAPAHARVRRTFVDALGTNCLDPSSYIVHGIFRK